MHTGQAAKKFSSLLNIKLSHVQSICKYLREEDILPTGGRGSSAPHLSDIEIARLLVTLMVTEVAGQAAERCVYFCSLPVAIEESFLIREQADRAKAWTLETVLANIFQGLRSGDIKAFELADFETIFSSIGLRLKIDIPFGSATLFHKTDQSPLCFSMNDFPDSQEHESHACPYYSPIGKVVSVNHGILEEVAKFAAIGNGGHKDPEE